MITNRKLENAEILALEEAGPRIASRLSGEAGSLSIATPRKLAMILPIMISRASLVSLFPLTFRVAGALGLTLTFLTTAPAAEDPPSSKAPSTLKASGLRFPVTEGWSVKSEPRAMSAGGLTFKTEALESGLDADFYHFGKGQGGSVAANIARWKGQFEGQPKEVETTELAGGKIDFLYLEGTFLSGPPFGQKTHLKDHAMLAAILEHSDGPVFIKMTGPKEEVAKAIVAFKALAKSAFKN